MRDQVEPIEEQEHSPVKVFLLKYWFPAACFLAVLFKYFLIQGIPLTAAVYAFHDHRLMVDCAYDILNGDWLGKTYFNRHLAKGCGYPVLIVIQNLLGLTLHQMAWLLYSAGCLLMMRAFRPIVKYRVLQFLILCFLLFCPAYDSSLTDTYRTWVQSWQLLFIYSSLIAIFLRWNDLKSITLWSLPGILGTVFYWHSFENGFWTLALYGVSTVVIAGYSLWNRDKWVRILLKSILIPVPLYFVFLSSEFISAVNQYKYGFRGTTIFTGGNFPRLMRAIYSVKPAHENYNLPVAVPRETFRRIYAVSPTLAQYRTEFARSFDWWGAYVRFPDDGEVETGWLYWCLLAHFEKMDFKTQDRIFKKAAKEIETAVKNKKLESRPVMPSVLMAPWRQDFLQGFRQLPQEFLSSVRSFKSLNSLINCHKWIKTKKISDKEMGKRLPGIYLFSTVYRDTFYVNEKTPLRSDLLYLETLFCHFWIACNPFFFHLAFFCLAGQLLLACLCRKKEVFFLLFVPLSICGGISVLLGGLIYVHLSSFPTWSYLLPVRGLFQMLTVAATAVFVFSLLDKNCYDLPGRLRHLDRKNWFREPAVYGVFAVLLLSMFCVWGVSRWLDVKQVYTMHDRSPGGNRKTVAILSLSDRNWENGSSRIGPILLLGNTKRNRTLLEGKRFFSIDQGKDRYSIANVSEHGPYLWLKYTGKRIKLENDGSRIFFVDAQ